MILSDRELRVWLANGSIVVRPLAENAVQPASVDLRLGSLLRIAEYRGYREHHLVDDGPFWMSQFSFILASTMEWVETGNHAAVLAGKSSRAREGLILENAGYVDPGWRGELTLELFALSPRPRLLTHGMLIGQIRFETLSSPCERPYGSEGLGSHYQNSRGPVVLEAP